MGLSRSGFYEITTFASRWLSSSTVKLGSKALPPIEGIELDAFYGGRHADGNKLVFRQ
jgi:hypothetical protein